MVAIETHTSSDLAAQHAHAGNPRNVVPDLSDVFADRGAARGVASNLHDRLSEQLRGVAYLPGV